jgi:hypothetical protein
MILSKINTCKSGLMLMLLFVGFNQTKAGNEVAASDSVKPAVRYWQSSIGLSNPSYRDFATSPLFYRGVGFNISTGWLKRSAKKERLFDMLLSAAPMSANIPTSNYLKRAVTSTFVQMSLRYVQLYELKSLSKQKNKYKAGFALHATQNFRMNRFLQNNATGVENVSNVMLTGQVMRDVSRSSEKKVNLLFFKPTLKPVKRDLRFQLNVGVLNFNYRPGYAFAYEGYLTSNTSPLLWILNNYSWSLNGWRTQGELELLTYLEGGNARSWTYVWSAMHIPGKFENFQMAMHQIKYTVFFQRTKKKS